METNRPLVSVIIPTYNRAGVIKNAIESVLCQTYGNIEIIVVDDGSTDNTKDALLSCKDRIKYFYKENGGVSSARNFGIREARGEYVAFLDSDDIWLPPKIERQLDLLAKNNDLDCMIGDIEFIDISGKVMKRSDMRKQIPHDGMILKYLVKNFQTMCTILMKREIFADVGYFDEELKTAEDIDMLLRIASKYKIGVTEQPLIRVRTGYPSLSGEIFTGNRLIALEKIGQYNPAFLSENKELIQKKISEINMQYAEDLLWHGYYDVARIAIFKSLSGHMSLKSFILLLKTMVKPVLINVKYCLKRLVSNRIIFFCGNKRGPRVVAVTFDDGPNGVCTERLLNILKDEGVRATFFAVGKEAAGGGHIFDRMKTDGHEVGNHSFNHDRKVRSDDIEKADIVIEKLTGSRPKLYRPPYGNFGPAQLWRSITRGTPIVMWSVDSNDTALRTPSALTKYVESLKIRSGDVMLFHEDYQHTCDAMKSIIQDLKNRKFNFVTVSEMMKR